ncbi:MAG: Gfo/Idh/MocA family protein [Armatimonadota bacterium]
MPDQPLRGLTIGCGYFGLIQLDGWQRVNGARIAAACDLDPAKAQAAAHRFDIENAYTNPEEALAAQSYDFVDIATRPDSHLELTRAAAEAGAAVLCQKPLAMTWDESVAIVDAARERGVRFMANENWRWQPWFREMKRLLDDGAIGPPHTFCYRRRGADALSDPPFPRQPYFTQMEKFLLIESVIHQIDTARFLLGDLEAVFCNTRRISGVTLAEDAVTMILHFTSGAAGLIDASRCAEEEGDREGWDIVVLEGMAGYLRLRADRTIWHKPLFRPARRHDYSCPDLGYLGDSCRATQQHFADCLRSGQPFEQEPEEYLNQTVRAVFAGYQSAETGRIVPV